MDPTSLAARGAFVGGAWQETAATVGDVDPARDETLAEVARCGAVEVDSAVEAARAAADEWRGVSALDRGRTLNELADLIEQRSEEVAWLVSLDSGKPLSQARGDVRNSVRHFRFYAGAVDKVGGREIPLDDDHVTFTRWEPRGVTAHITPWNNPISIPARSIAAALAMGNAVVVKPSELAPLPVLALAELFFGGPLPDGVFNVVPGLGHEAGAALAGHPRVDSVTFTGSVATGAAVMEAASRNITPVSLELGGKAPQVVFADADMTAAVAGCRFGIVRNAGQSCIAGTRIYVQEQAYEEFLDRLAKELEAVTVGAGTDDPDMGPLITRAQLERIERIIDGVRGKVVVGGVRPDLPPDLAKGFFLRPTLVANVDPGETVAAEELFAPVATIAPFTDEEEALVLANRGEYGLSAGVWTGNLGRAHRVANGIRAGSISVNAYPIRYYHGPHGGYKKSGIGREQGLEALEHYVEIKKVGIRIR